MLNTYEASNAILRQIHTSVYLKTLQNEVLKIDVEQKKKSSYVWIGEPLSQKS